MDASAHTLHTFGGTDNGGDPSPSQMAVTVTAEQQALNELFGLKVELLDNPELGQKIAARIFGIVHSVYSSLDQAGLSNLIETNANAAVNRIDPGIAIRPSLDDQRRIDAVTKAVYKSIPQDLLERFTLATLPATVSSDHLGRGTGMMTLTIVGLPQFRINTDLPFWRSIRDTSSVPAIVDAIMNPVPPFDPPRACGPEDLGIQPPAPYVFAVPGGVPTPLTALQANQIASAKATILELPNAVSMSDFNCECPPGTSIKFSVKVNEMLAAWTTADAPTGLQNRPIYSFTIAEIQTLLEHPGKNGDFYYYKKYVTGGATHPGQELTNFNFQPIPGGAIANTPGPVTAAEMAAEIVHAMLGYGIPANRPVGSRTVDFLEVHRDIQRKVDDNRDFLSKLREGENGHGAIIAASMALSDPKIYAEVSNLNSESKIQKELNEVRAKIELSKQLKNMNDLKINLKLPTIPPATPSTYELIEKESRMIIQDISAVGVAPSWSSEFCKQNFSTMMPNTISGTADKRDIQSRLQPQMQLLKEELTQYEILGDSLKRIAQCANSAGIFGNSTALANLVTNAGVIQKGNISSNFNHIERAEVLRNELKFETDDELTASIKKLEEKLKIAKDKGLKGDVLQQRIFEEHFKGQGLSDLEARRSANYLYSRSFIDNELDTQIKSLHDDLFEDHAAPDLPLGLDKLNFMSSYQAKKDLRVMENLARAVGLHPRITPSYWIYWVPGKGLTSRKGRPSEFDWHQLSYPKLITAYFATKKLEEGTGPEYINSPESAVFKKEMHAIADEISRRNVNFIINDFGNDLDPKEKEKLQSRKTITVELAEKMLTGSAPEKYSRRIENVLHHTDAWTDRVRRGIFGGAISAATKTAGAAGIVASKTTNTVKSTAKLGWNHRKNIATCAAMTALGGPIGFAVWAGFKAWNAPDASIQHGGSHA